MSSAGIPLHRLNTAQTKLWLIQPRPMAAFLAKQYKTGVGVLSATLLLFAYVAPDGTIRALTPPFKRYGMWEVANAPSMLYNECACRNYVDPEFGKWSNRPGATDHHPFCQFDRTAMSVFNQAGDEATDRIARGLSAQARPDEWTRLRAAYQGR